MRKRPFLRGAVPIVLAAAMTTSFAGQAFAAPAQPGTVKESEKPAAQPGTEKKSAPKPAVQEAAPAPSPKPAVQEAAPAPSPKPAVQEAAPAPSPKPAVQEAAPAPSPKPAVQEAAPAPSPKPAVQEAAPAPAEDEAEERTSNVTPVRKQESEPEVESVREKSAPDTPTTAEFRTAVHTEAEDRREGEEREGVVPTAEVVRTDEEEEAEVLPELEDDDLPTPPVPAEGQESPVSDPAAEEAEPAFSGGASVEGAAAAAEVTADTTPTTGVVHSELNVGAGGAGMTVDTNPTTSVVQGDVTGLGQQATGEIQVTEVEAQEIYEVSANGGAPLEVHVPAEVTTAVEDVTAQVEQIEVPAEVTTAVEQANGWVTDVSDQVEAAMPTAETVEAVLPAGVTASAWYEVTE